MTINWLITGANRGLGFGLVQALSTRPDTVIFASARDPSSATELNKLAKSSTAKVHVVKLLAGSEADAKAVAKQAAEVGGLDYIILNAGISQHYAPAATTDIDQVRDHFEVNLVGPLVIFQATLPEVLKKQTRKLLFISTGVASLTKAVPMLSTAYGASKAALNYLVTKIHQEHSKDGLIAISLSPGFVDTDMGRMGADSIGLKSGPPVKVTDSVKGQLEIIENATTETSGKFLSYDGTEIPW